MWLALIALVVLGSGTALAVSLPKVQAEHAGRGLFGAVAREGLISTWATEVVDVAERQVRLGHFGGSLRARVWEGTTAEIRHTPVGATTWRFATGEIWEVDLAAAAPRWARRVVVRSVEQAAEDLRLSVYVPRGQDLVMSVRDARPTFSPG